jgi:transcriptional regulator with XRE-family HTH domain
MLRALRELEGWTYKQLMNAFEIPKATVACLCKYRRR